MRRWQIWIVAGVLCFVSSSAVQAQNLFERLGQSFTQEIPPTPSTDEAVPEVTIPEALPAPPSAVQLWNRRPTLGVTVDPLTDGIVRQRRLPVRSGAVITAIVQGSPADQAGLPLGAVIVALDGRRVDSPADLVAAIRTAPTDREVELSYYEGDRLYRKRVHLLGGSVTQVAPTAPAPLRGDPSFEQQFGGQGQRPMLGRVGQLLDGLVAPASHASPIAQPAAEPNETALLREQVSMLQQELALLRARLAVVEKQLEIRVTRE